MSKSLDANLNLRALILLGLIAFALYLAAERGMLGLALQSDRSYISYVILLVYALASAHWLWVAQQLSRERSRFVALESTLESIHEGPEERALPRELPDSEEFSGGLLGSFLGNWRRRGDGGDPSALVNAFGDQLANRHALGHFVADALLKLGLLGTIVGFILMLLPVGQISEFDGAVMQQLLGEMSGGMAVALYTTLAGLVTSTLLKLQYHVLDASVAELVTRLSVATEIHLSGESS